MHDALNIGVPVVAILAGILLNRADVKELRQEMQRSFGAVDRRFDAVNARFDAIDAELRYFQGFTGKLDGRIESLEKRQS